MPDIIKQLETYRLENKISQEELAEKLDVAFCTIGIAPGASPEAGVEIAKLTKPKVAVPYHTGSAADQKRFAELLKKELPKTHCLIPEVGKIYEVSKRG